jgi:hypothetical protein
VFAVHAQTWQAGLASLRQAVQQPTLSRQAQKTLLDQWHRSLNVLAYQTQLTGLDDTEIVMMTRELDRCIHDVLAEKPLRVRKTVKKGPSQMQIYQHTQTDPVYHPLLGSASPPNQLPQAPLLSARLTLWHYLTTMAQSFAVRFALKSSLTALLLALPSFPSPTLAWSIMSAFVIVSPTVGGSNRAGILRLFGTALGIGYAMTVATLKGPATWSIIALAIPALYMMIQTSYPKVGQVSLIAACLILLGPWGDDAVTMGWRQGASVLIGVFAGLIVSWVRLFYYMFAHSLVCLAIRGARSAA